VRNEPNDMSTELPYDEMTAAQFRAEVAAVAQRQHDQFGVLINTDRTDRKLSRAEQHLQMASMHAANFGWSLVALIRWAEKAYGPEAGWKAAALAQDIMTNGGNSFCEDVDLPLAAEQTSSTTRPKPEHADPLAGEGVRKGELR
jgi:hypothetical protein